jgi:hypothetical protein
MFLRILISILCGLVVSAILFLLGGFLGGACHCNTPMTVFFPFGTMVSMRTSWESVGFLLIGIQFPLYALIMVAAKEIRKQSVAVGFLAAIHMLAVVFAILANRL